MSSEESEVEESGSDPLPVVKPFFSRAGGKIFIIWLAMTAVGIDKLSKGRCILGLGASGRG